MKHIALVSAAALGLSAAAASAATIMDTDSFGPSLTEFASSSASSVNPLSGPINASALELDLFDSSLGTLTSVEVMLTGGFTSEGTVLNSSTGAQTANAQEDATFFFSSTMFVDTNFTAGDATGFQSFASGPAGTAVDLGATESTTFNPGTTGYSGAAGDTFLIDFGTLVGTSFQGGGGNLTFDVDTLGTVEAKVTYTFDEAAPVVVVPTVPLPAGALLLGTALFGLGFARRKS